MAWSRTSRHARGYGSEWDRLRAAVLKRDSYLCQCKQCQGGKLRLTVATEVDHRIPKARGGGDDPSNLQAINRDCHKRKTIEETGKAYAPRVQIGADGYPITEP